MEKIHYPNLNFVRCVAALIVMVHHTEQLKAIHHYPNHWGMAPVQQVGKLGVDLFFVLSGFLITSLLYVEKNMLNHISIKKFLMRRVLRIWPVYFLIFIFAFFIAPNISWLQLGDPFIPVSASFTLNFVLYIFFLPHFQVFLVGPILYCAQAWSIGIEEYFYLFWPFVINKLKSASVKYFIIGFVFCYLCICLLCRHLAHTVFLHNSTFQNITVCFFEGLKFDCLLIGALFAGIHRNLKTGTFLTSKLFQIFLYSCEIVLIWRAYSFSGFYWEIHAVIYGLIILNLVRSQTSIINMEYPVFNFLGKISYGMYMYHFLIINIVMQVVYKTGMPLLLYPMAFLAVIGIAALSYKYMEKYFLTKKLSYSNLITG